jgi:peptidoglycan/xylan/chitin deacetylase (PgdA/CDA1 family)
VSAVTPILCYHAVGDDLPADELPFAFPVEVFASHLDEIAARGLRTVTVSELARSRSRGDADALDRTVAITFDDGYADLLSVVAPLLAERSMVATAFVTTAYVDGRSAGEAGYERWLSWDEAAALAQSGLFEIGGHSHDHVELDMLPADAARLQIRRCRERLREELGIEPTSFAYPYGYSNDRIRALLPEAGFTTACGVRHAISTPDDDPMNLARVRLLRRHSPTTVRDWISATNLRTTPCPDELRTRVFRPVRRLRHTLRTGRAVSPR